MERIKKKKEKKKKKKVITEKPHTTGNIYKA
jgi:hypothetical protein